MGYLTKTCRTSDLGTAPWPRTLDGFIGDLFRPIAAATGAAGWNPRANVVEGAEDYVLTLEIPGMAKGGVSVTTEGDTLTIKGEKSSEEAQEGAQLHVSERSFGKFERSFRFAQPLAEDDVNATVADGILTVLVKKPQETRSRTIEIKSA